MFINIYIQRFQQTLYRHQTFSLLSQTSMFGLRTWPQYPYQASPCHPSSPPSRLLSSCSITWVLGEGHKKPKKIAAKKETGEGAGHSLLYWRSMFESLQSSTYVETLCKTFMKNQKKINIKQGIYRKRQTQIGNSLSLKKFRFVFTPKNMSILTFVRLTL